VAEVPIHRPTSDLLSATYKILSQKSQQKRLVKPLGLHSFPATGSIQTPYAPKKVGMFALSHLLCFNQLIRKGLQSALVRLQPFVFGKGLFREG
jgi:hypothetical protein